MKTHLTKSDRWEIEEKIEKIDQANYDQGLNLIYEWTKTDCINKRQFKFLLELNESKLEE